MQEWNERGRRTELLRGVVLEKLVRSPLHSSIATRLFVRILQLAPPGYLVRQEQPLTFHDSEPEPDVAIVAAPPGEEYASAHPTSAELVIEVAVSSAALDRANASLYAEAGVKEYWIVLAQSHSVEVYRDPRDGEYRERRVHERGEELISTALPAVRLTVEQICG